MKKLFAALVLLTATVASAGTYSITTNAAQDARLTRQVARVNKATCASVQLPADCTQAQARNINPALDVFSSVLDYLDRGVVKALANGLKNADTTDDAAQAASAWGTMTDAQKNNVCALLGLPGGCEAWPR